MKIVALELKNIGKDVDLSDFDNLGEFDRYETTKIEDIEARCKDADVIIMNKLPINETTIGGLDKLKLVCVTATGYDNVDIDYCNKRGITVCNVKGYSTNSVVQHTFATFFYIYEKLSYYDNYVKSGKYCNNDIFTHFDRYFNELSGKKWGVVGLGNIGQKVADVATVFGCDVIYYSTSGKNNNPKYKQVDFDTLLRESDIISIHAPLNKVTNKMFSAEAFHKMKPSAYIINMGRGPIIDEKSLKDALNEGIIAGAALDVLDKEPMIKDNPLFEVKEKDKLLITPHIAWATKEARQRLMYDVYSNIDEFFNGKPRNVVL